MYSYGLWGRGASYPTMNIRFGYARVSTHEQTVDLQIDALTAAGCERRHIYTDTCSGCVVACGPATRSSSGAWTASGATCRT